MALRRRRCGHLPSKYKCRCRTDYSSAWSYRGRRADCNMDVSLADVNGSGGRLSTHDVPAGMVTNPVSLFEGPVAWRANSDNFVSTLRSDSGDGEEGYQPDDSGVVLHVVARMRASVEDAASKEWQLESSCVFPVAERGAGLFVWFVLPKKKIKEENGKWLDNKASFSTDSKTVVNCACRGQGRTPGRL